MTSVMQQALIGSYSSGGDAPTLLNTSTTTNNKFTLAGESYSYPFSVSSGDSVVIAFACRVNDNSNPSSTYTVTDSVGNTWSQIVTMGGGVSQVAIFKCDLTTSVTTSSTITISSSGVDDQEQLGLGWFHFGTGTATLVDQSKSSRNTFGSQSVSMGTTTGTVIHVIASGLLTPITGLTSSTGFTQLLEYTNNGSSTYIYYKENVTGNVTNTVSANSGQWASAAAGFA